MASASASNGYVFGDGGDGTADRGGPHVPGTHGDIRRFESAAASLVPLSARRLYTDAMRPAAAAAVAVAVATSTTTITITITSITNITATATTTTSTTTTTTTTTTSTSTTTSTTITATTTTSTYHRDT
uniref:Uncharacterized protein n=1 Tax=Vespula pensylvanica TaxID=30213 RepID=A0A834UB46_VESPE|nr:hypothetical protein H0235_006986 [Vespula pensylvanica]